MRSLEQVNIRTNVGTYVLTYVRDRPYIPSTTLLCEGIINLQYDLIKSNSKLNSDDLKYWTIPSKVVIYKG